MTFCPSEITKSLQCLCVQILLFLLPVQFYFSSFLGALCLNAPSSKQLESKIIIIINKRNENYINKLQNDETNFKKRLVNCKNRESELSSNTQTQKGQVHNITL